MIATKHAEVLIVGAGPTGLMMAAQLLRYGIQPIIIDARSGPSTQSKALVVQARTLEIYDQLGVAEEALANGHSFFGAQVHLGADEYTLDFSDGAAGKTAFPFALIYEQHKNERLLLNLLTKNACAVLWETELLDFKPGDGLYHMRIFHQQKEQLFSCRYLIGADGAGSRVRKQSGISFEGGTYPGRFFLVDAVLKNPPQNKLIHFFLRGRNFLGLFPMFDANTYRLIGILPKNLPQKEPGFEDLQPLIGEIIPQMPIEKCNWFSLYNLHHRSVGTFSQGNVFLAGDAAHIHSPAGGQGMNTGLQDATNLAWKLAGVINGHFDARILSTYNTERLPIARGLVKTTDRLFSMMTAPNRFIRSLRNLVLPVFFWADRAEENQHYTGFFARVADRDCVQAQPVKFASKP